jgi:hypothetical protein
MTIKTWLDNAIQDSDRRGLSSLRPMLESLARSTSTLRTADWNYDSSGDSGWSPASPDSDSPAAAPAAADRSGDVSAPTPAKARSAAEADGR